MTMQRSDTFQPAKDDTAVTGTAGHATGRTVAVPESAPAPRTEVAARSLRNLEPGTIELTIFTALLLLLIAMALFPSLFTSYNPIAAAPADRLQPPSWTHLFGTDQIGRDLFARVVYGARASMQSGALAVGIALVCGSTLGLIAGFVGGRTDTVIGRVTDAMLAIPGLMLALAVLSAIGNGSTPAAIAVGVAVIPIFVRLMRAETMRITASVYVEAAHASGAKPFTILWRHILPNAWGVVSSLAVLEFGQSLLIIGSLSYLGFGAEPPRPEWGSLISSGQSHIATAWWLSILPGLVLASAVLVINRVANILQRRY